MLLAAPIKTLLSHRFGMVYSYKLDGKCTVFQAAVGNLNTTIGFSLSIVILKEMRKPMNWQGYTVATHLGKKCFQTTDLLDFLEELYNEVLTIKRNVTIFRYFLST